jgi:hypothetical protein
MSAKELRKTVPELRGAVKHASITHARNQQITNIRIRLDPVRGLGGRSRNRGTRWKPGSWSGAHLRGNAPLERHGIGKSTCSIASRYCPGGGSIPVWLRALAVAPLTRNTFHLRLAALYSFARRSSVPCHSRAFLRVSAQ